jgi:large subunit ribosomal protein L6
MIVGSQSGFKKTLIVEGVGYRVNVEGKKIILSVGYSNPVEFILPSAVSASVANNQIVLESIDKGMLGQTAAKIREIRKPEPYKGKGIRYENEHIVRKAGKTAGKK